MAFRQDTHGTSAPFGFAVAGGILIVIIGGLLLATQAQPKDIHSSEEEIRRQDAAALLDLMMDSKGAGWGGGADTVTQLGILAENGSGLDLSRMASMQGALYDATNNGKLDYNESLALLGMDPDGSQQFHLRVAPVGLVTVLTEDLSGIKTAYIADADANIDTSFSVSLGADSSMTAEARAELEADIDAFTVLERQALTTLGLGYDDQINLNDMDLEVSIPGPDPDLADLLLDPDLLDGDVYPDKKQYLNDLLPMVLDDYEVLIIGSNVDHSSLTSNSVKQGIEDWVEDGGTLMVFGSDSQSFQWMQSLMGVGIETANGGSFAPDVDHPVLREPHQLDWPAYQNFDQAWGGKSGGNNNFDDLFQHIIQEDDGDVLAISLDGAFGDGRIFLSTYRPHDIANNVDLQEAMNLLNNLVVYSDRSHLYLDYGPAPPQDQSVGAASRTSYVWDPDLGQVPVRVTMLTWG